MRGTRLHQILLASVAGLAAAFIAGLLREAGLVGMIEEDLQAWLGASFVGAESSLQAVPQLSRLMVLAFAGVGVAWVCLDLRSHALQLVILVAGLLLVLNSAHLLERGGYHPNVVPLVVTMVLAYFLGFLASSFQGGEGWQEKRAALKGRVNGEVLDKALRDKEWVKGRQREVVLLVARVEGLRADDLYTFEYGLKQAGAYVENIDGSRVRALFGYFGGVEDEPDALIEAIEEAADFLRVHGLRKKVGKNALLCRKGDVTARLVEEGREEPVVLWSGRNLLEAELWVEEMAERKADEGLSGLVWWVDDACRRWLAQGWKFVSVDDVAGRSRPWMAVEALSRPEVSAPAERKTPAVTSDEEPKPKEELKKKADLPASDKGADEKPRGTDEIPQVEKVEKAAASHESADKSTAPHPQKLKQLKAFALNLLKGGKDSTTSDAAKDEDEEKDEIQKDADAVENADAEVKQRFPGRGLMGAKTVREQQASADISGSPQTAPNKIKADPGKQGGGMERDSVPKPDSRVPQKPESQSAVKPLSSSPAPPQAAKQQSETADKKEEEVKDAKKGGQGTPEAAGRQSQAVSPPPAKQGESVPDSRVPQKPEPQSAAKPLSPSPAPPQAAKQQSETADKKTEEVKDAKKGGQGTSEAAGRQSQAVSPPPAKQGESVPDSRVPQKPESQSAVKPLSPSPVSPPAARQQSETADKKTEEVKDAKKGVSQPPPAAFASSQSQMPLSHDTVRITLKAEPGRKASTSMKPPMPSSSVKASRRLSNVGPSGKVGSDLESDRTLARADRQEGDVLGEELGVRGRKASSDSHGGGNEKKSKEGKVGDGGGMVSWIKGLFSAEKRSGDEAVAVDQASQAGGRDGDSAAEEGEEAEEKRALEPEAQSTKVKVSEGGKHRDLSRPQLVAPKFPKPIPKNLEQQKRGGAGTKPQPQPAPQQERVKPALKPVQPVSLKRHVADKPAATVAKEKQMAAQQHGGSAVQANDFGATRSRTTLGQIPKSKTAPVRITLPPPRPPGEPPKR